MTCVWDSLVAGLRGLPDAPASPAQLLLAVQTNNAPPRNVTRNNTPFTERQCAEVFDAISVTKISASGYDCAACDPLLAAVCQLYTVNINHNFGGACMRYAVPQPRRTFALTSSTSHMSLS